MRRREFITLLGGAVAGWPITARAQPDRIWHIGVPMPEVESDPEAKAGITAFRGDVDHGQDQTREDAHEADGVFCFAPAVNQARKGGG